MVRTCWIKLAYTPKLIFDLAIYTEITGLIYSDSYTCSNYFIVLNYGKLIAVTLSPFLSPHCDVMATRETNKGGCTQDGDMIVLLVRFSELACHLLS